MASADSDYEWRALATSLAASTLLGTVAIIWGVISSSRVVLFDGMFSLAGIVLVGVSMLAARVAVSAPTKQYPFGRHAATPLAVALQGAALLATVAYGAADAVIVIRDGGSDAAATSVVIYGVVSAVASIAVMGWLRSYARHSALAKAEWVSWRASSLLSVMVAVGGGIAVALNGSGHPTIASYVDPILVLIACVSVTPMAIGLIREGMRELLEAAPPAPLMHQINGVVEATSRRFELPTPVIRSTKLGQRLYVEVDYLISDHQEFGIDDEDEIRRSITDGLGELGYQVWATVELTTDDRLID